MTTAEKSQPKRIVDFIWNIAISKRTARSVWLFERGVRSAA
jgi:hypothetical protein